MAINVVKSRRDCPVAHGAADNKERDRRPTSLAGGSDIILKVVTVIQVSGSHDEIGFSTGPTS